jgi:hypothetical protein
LILIFVFDFFVRKKLSMRINNEVAHSSHGRTIRPTEVAIARVAFTRGNGSGARGSRGGRGPAVAPREGRGSVIAPRGGRGVVVAPKRGRGAATAPRGRGVATSPRGGRVRRLEFFSEEGGLPQLQDDTYGSDEEEERNDEGDGEENEGEEENVAEENEGEEENNVAEAQENENEEEDGEQPALWLCGPLVCHLCQQHIMKSG